MNKNVNKEQTETKKQLVERLTEIYEIINKDDILELDSQLLYKLRIEQDEIEQELFRGESQ